MAWFNASWLKRRKFSTANAQVLADDTNFPLLVEFDDADVTLQSLGEDIRIADADETTQLDHVHEPQSLNIADDRVWTYYVSHEAVYDSVAGRTYIGSANKAGDILLDSINAADGSKSTFTLKSALQADDHNNASVIILQHQGDSNDGKILAAYTGHITANVYCRRSTNANDASAFDSEVQIVTGGSNTYAQLFEFTDGTVRCYHRASDNYVYRESTDGGATWGASTTFYTHAGTNHPYFRIAEDPANHDIHHFFYGEKHPNEVSAGEGDLRYFKYDDSTGVWSDAAGSTITVPHVEADGTLIYDASANSNRPGWIVNAAVDGTGRPCCVFATFVSAADGSSQQMWYGVIDSGTPTVNMISTLGTKAQISPYDVTATRHYSPGAYIDPASADTVYYFKTVGSYLQLFEAVTANDGVSWTETQLTNDRQKKFRPIVPVNAIAGLKVLYLRGGYESYAEDTAALGYFCGMTSYPVVKSESWRVLCNKPALDGDADDDIYAYYDNSGASDDQDAANAVDANTLLWDICKHRDIVDYGLVSMINLTALTVVVVCEYDGSGSASDAILSNWDGTGAGLLLRHDGSSVLQAFVRVVGGGAGANVGGTFSDKTLTTGRHTIQVTYDTTNGLQLWLDGSKSTTTFSANGALRATASTIRLRAGVESSTNATVIARKFNGRVETVIISTNKRGDNYLGTQENNLIAAHEDGSFWMMSAEETDSAGIKFTQLERGIRGLNRGLNLMAY